MGAQVINPIAVIGNDVLQRARRSALVTDYETRRRAVIVICQKIARSGHLDGAAETALRLELAMLESAREALDAC
jgi:hypothetical protein